MNVALFEPKWHKMACRLLVLVETKFKRCLFCGSRELASQSQQKQNRRLYLSRLLCNYLRSEADSKQGHQPAARGDTLCRASGEQYNSLSPQPCIAR